jgi:predicted DNA-binding transcriptional regulator AlpA
LDERGLAKRFGNTRAHWRKLRREHKGPKYYKIGRLVRYSLADVEAWLEQFAVYGGEDDPESPVPQFGRQPSETRSTAGAQS